MMTHSMSILIQGQLHAVWYANVYRIDSSGSYSNYAVNSAHFDDFKHLTVIRVATIHGMYVAAVYTFHTAILWQSRSTVV